ncbi:MAG: pyrroline-5-carboxylate reductase [Candidatus Saganbacteria bacterium]|nr:pyrroline-5-carboxylate reductase [Candidatus Saganbacteria bacterium]
MPSNKKISFIGAGRMADAIISGIIRAKLFSPKNIYISDKEAQRLKYLSETHKVHVAQDNIKAMLVADIVVLCVKPQHKKNVLDEIREFVESEKLFISIAAGITIGYLEKHLAGCPVVRAMPNNPCLIGEGMTVISKGSSATESDVKTAEKIFSSLGKTVLMDEKFMDAVTGLSGSGPAFVYKFLEGMIEGGVKAGLKKEDAEVLAKQTMLGAVKTVIETRKNPKELCGMVASPGGTTIEGLKILDEAKLIDIVADAVYAAAARARDLSKEFST